MNYDPVFDKWHEECGVFGVYDRTVDVARYVYWVKDISGNDRIVIAER